MVVKRIALKRISKPKKRGGNNRADINPWIQFVKAYAAQNGLSYSDALKVAAGPYRTWKRNR